jgi:hypothetical protein
MPKTHSADTRALALTAVDSGLAVPAVAELLGISWTSVYSWLRQRGGWEPTYRTAALTECVRCRRPPSFPGPSDDYVHLLGLYLGDGHVVRTGGSSRLSIACADAWPGLIDEAERAMRAVLGRDGGWRNTCKGCTSVESSWKHWPCLFPQAGPGRKHERPIVLEPWQNAMAAAQPGRLLRGLFHSDGWRGTNFATNRGKRYEYPRYKFMNKSDDILGICGWALDMAGVRWRRNNRHKISVARKDAVARLDEFVGPKY